MKLLDPKRHEGVPAAQGGHAGPLIKCCFSCHWAPMSHMWDGGAAVTLHPVVIGMHVMAHLLPRFNGCSPPVHHSWSQAGEKQYINLTSPAIVIFICGGFRFLLPPPRSVEKSTRRRRPIPCRSPGSAHAGPRPPLELSVGVPQMSRERPWKSLSAHRWNDFNYDWTL